MPGAAGQVFLGGSEPTTLKELTEALGKETIDTYNTSDTRGKSPSYGTKSSPPGTTCFSPVCLADLGLGNGKTIQASACIRTYRHENAPWLTRPGGSRRNVMRFAAFRLRFFIFMTLV